MKSLKRYCPECDLDTSQRIEKSNSTDDSKGIEVYICDRCGECTGYVENETLFTKLKLSIKDGD